MAKEVGVFNAPPIYVLGLTGLSSASGYLFETVENPFEWLHHHGQPVLIAGVVDRGDLDVVIAVKSDAPDSVVVTLLDQVDIGSIRDSLAAGAAGAVSRHAGVGELILALNAALAESTLMPTNMARIMAAHCGNQSPSCLDDAELAWLQSLAGMATVVSLSQFAGYSEREMYRRLKAMYRKMGVGTRTEALLKASRLGWIS
ncbi:MAG TPA: hypothetical protein VMS99_16635 [Acidimicrobiia bacterium]|nr:hypothetical protein [Acidimicrobiia bacterium]